MALQAGTFRCKACGVKATQLGRKLGQWPIPAFAGLSNEERQAFMASLDGMSAAEMAAKASEAFERFETQTQALQPLWCPTLTRFQRLNWHVQFSAASEADEARGNQCD